MAKRFALDYARGTGFTQAGQSRPRIELEGVLVSGLFMQASK